MSELGLRSTACQVPICSLRSYWDRLVGTGTRKKPSWPVAAHLVRGTLVHWGFLRFFFLGVVKRLSTRVGGSRSISWFARLVS